MSAQMVWAAEALEEVPGVDHTAKLPALSRLQGVAIMVYFATQSCLTLADHPLALHRTPSVPKTLALVGIDLLLFLKVIAFIPSNWWLWRYGPNIAARIRKTQASREWLLSNPSKPDVYVRAAKKTAADEQTAGYQGTSGDIVETGSSSNLKRSKERDDFLRAIETQGSGSVKIGKREYEAIPRLRLLGPPRSEKFHAEHKIIYYLLNIAWSTPVLVAACSFLAVPLAASASLSSAVAAVALLSIVASLTLLTAPITRMTLGSFDVHWAGLQPYLRRFRGLILRGYARSSNGRDGLVFYFLTLFTFSMFAYAACYYILFVLQRNLPEFIAFDFPDKAQSPNWITWLYFSAITVATVGYGDITPHNHWAQLVVAVQVMTGPFLITWLLTIVLSDRGTG